MGNQDWNQLGNDIKDMVQDAVNTRDFSKLNAGINHAINGAMDNLGNLCGGGSKGGYWEIRDDGQARPEQPGQRPTYQKPNQQKPYYGWQTKASAHKNQIREPKVKQPASKRDPLPPGPYKSPSGISAVGYIMAIFGGVVASGTGVALLICLLVSLMGPSMSESDSMAMNLANSILFSLTLLSGAVCWGGTRKIGLAKRFRNYVRCIRGRGYCQLEELSKGIGRPVSFIRKDVKHMLNKGLFLEGHLDSQETCLITTNQAYDQYKTAQRQLEERQRQETAPQQARQEPEDKNVPDEVQEILDEGNTFLARIRKCNDLIPGREISEKISRMELIVQNIFKRVQNHPEVVPNLKKMMEYYLPTTVKLLDAYAELDAQPVQGENITNSKREIEQTLDTLNQAFEKLLDSIFKDTAWDVSTDISVLQTLLAQEGLMGDDFKMQ